MSLAPPPPLVFPPAIGSAVRDAANAFFVTYCGMEPVEKPDTQSDVPCAGIMGMISFVGDPSWSFALILPEPTAVALSEKFAGFPIEFDSPDMGDVAGEFVNVMAGDICARLDAKGIKAQMSLPTMARGHDVELLTPSDACALRMAFRSPTGDFSFKLVQARPSALFRRPGT